MSNYGGTKQYGPFYITAENLTSRSSNAFSNFAISWRTALIFIVLHTELVHLYTDSLKDMLKNFRLRLMGPQSDLSRLIKCFSYDIRFDRL